MTCDMRSRLVSSSPLVALTTIWSRRQQRAQPELKVPRRCSDGVTQEHDVRRVDRGRAGLTYLHIGGHGVAGQEEGVDTYLLHLRSVPAGTTRA